MTTFGLSLWCFFRKPCEDTSPSPGLQGLGWQSDTTTAPDVTVLLKPPSHPYLPVPILGWCCCAVRGVQDDQRAICKPNTWFISKQEGQCHYPRWIQWPNPHNGRALFLVLIVSSAVHLSGQLNQSSRSWPEGPFLRLWTSVAVLLPWLTCCEMDAFRHLPPPTAFVKAPLVEKNGESPSISTESFASLDSNHGRKAECAENAPGVRTDICWVPIICQPLS